MQKTSIEWAQASWNPTRGCSRISEGCRHCYAETMANRFSLQPGHHWYGFAKPHGGWTGRVELIESKLTEPLHWKKPRRIFVNSMSDLLHENLSFEDILRVYRVMQQAHWHEYLILTKRSKRLLEFTRWLAGADDISVAEWPRQCWLGVSCEDQATADERIPDLLATPAAVRWVSAEPLLSGIDFNHLQPGREVEIDALNGTHGVLRPHGGTNEHLDWIVVGGESGPGARPFDLAWARRIIADCKAAGVPVFMKQLGARPFQPESDGLKTERWPGGMPHANNSLRLKSRKGGNMAEWPADLQVREFPK